ncbi:response regulator transcription factor [Cereibacter sphaeroides]|uniref:response regulator transcription factor n=1 Tax=Cereibacter sphaeroides TaxID=1063 RepID=UPI002D7E9CB7|nr:response regulator transcription factor [Cereibacter sphaeroides]
MAAPQTSKGHRMNQPSALEGPISVLVADDQPLVRELILNLLAREPDMVAEGAEDLEGVLGRIAAHGPFDVILLDYFMPGIEDLRGVGRTITANGGRPVLLMSGNLPAEIVEGARRLGVRGFLPKTRFGAITEAVRAAAAEPALPQPSVAEPRSAEPLPAADGALLTEDERTILRELAEGCSTEAILARIGGEDLESRLRPIFDKLGARNRTHAILAAKRMGIV